MHGARTGLWGGRVGNHRLYPAADRAKGRVDPSVAWSRARRLTAGRSAPKIETAVCTHLIHRAKACYHCRTMYPIYGVKSMPLQHASAEFLAWAEHEGVDLTMLYERLQLTPTERLQRHQMALELVEALRHVKKGLGHVPSRVVADRPE